EFRMFSRVQNWLRAHPVRAVVYALLVAGGVWGALTVRGILRGERNPLLTRVAQSAVLRGWVEREFRVRYSLDAVGIRPECGTRILASGVKVELVNAAAGSLASANVCLQGASAVSGIRFGPDLVGVETLRLELPGSVAVGNLLWRDGD